jgi:uncharacterized protein YbbK (DUF523 family)
MRICSACLLGVKCRFDGNACVNEKVLKLAREEALIPVCPEILGGLATPRRPAEVRGKKVITDLEDDVSNQYAKGAEETLHIAQLYGIKEAVFKQNSPSCGCGKVHDGTFSDRIVKGDGITTALLKKNGVNVITEDDL